MTDISNRLSIPLTTVHREVERLADSDLVVARRVGRSRLVRANTHHRLAAALTGVLILTFGPHIVVEDEFAGIPGVERVIIYGSWAARYHGTPGPFPNDIDILIIGPANVRGAAYDAADRAQQRLGMPVNPTLSSANRWESEKDALIRSIKNSPKVEINPGGEKP